MPRLYVFPSVTILDQILYKIRLFSITGVYPKPNRSMGPLPPCVAPHPAIQRRVLLRAHGVSVCPSAGLTTHALHAAIPPSMSRLLTGADIPTRKLPACVGAHLGAEMPRLLEPSAPRVIGGLYYGPRRSLDIALFFQKSHSHPRPSSTLDRARICTPFLCLFWTRIVASLEAFSASSSFCLSQVLVPSPWPEATAAFSHHASPSVRLHLCPRHHLRVPGRVEHRYGAHSTPLHPSNPSL